MEEVIIKQISLVQPQYDDMYALWQKRVSSKKKLTIEEFVDILILRNKTRFILETINIRLNTNFKHSDFVSNSFLKFIVNSIEPHVSVKEMKIKDSDISFELHLSYWDSLEL